MTPPADLAALRELVETVDRSEIECLATIHQTCLHDLVPAAREALKRVEHARRTPITGENSAHDHGNCELCDWQEDRIARLEEARQENMELVVLLGRLADNTPDWPKALWFHGYMDRADAIRLGDVLAAIRARKEAS